MQRSTMALADRKPRTRRMISFWQSSIVSSESHSALRSWVRALVNVSGTFPLRMGEHVIESVSNSVRIAGFLSLRGETIEAGSRL